MLTREKLAELLDDLGSDLAAYSDPAPYVDPILAHHDALAARVKALAEALREAKRLFSGGREGLAPHLIVTMQVDGFDHAQWIRQAARAMEEEK